MRKSSSPKCPKPRRPLKNDMPRVLYLHGFASGPFSTKARHFRQRLESTGAHVDIPDLAAGDFEHLTLTGQLGEIERAAAGEPVAIAGSSMGGYWLALRRAASRGDAAGADGARFRLRPAVETVPGSGAGRRMAAHRRHGSLSLRGKSQPEPPLCPHGGCGALRGVPGFQAAGAHLPWRA